MVVERKIQYQVSLFVAFLYCFLFLLEGEDRDIATTEGICIDETLLGNGNGLCNAETILSKLSNSMAKEKLHKNGATHLQLFKPHQGTRILPIPAIGGSLIYSSFGEAYLNKKERHSDGLPVRVAGSIYRSMLKNALFKAAARIDSTCSDSRELACLSSSTAVVLLKVDGHLLLANTRSFKASSCFVWEGVNFAGNNMAHSNGWCACRLQDNLQGKEFYTDIGWPSLLCLQQLPSAHDVDRHDINTHIEDSNDYPRKLHGATLMNHQLAIKQALEEVSFKYILTKNVGRGGFGDLWLGSPRNSSSEEMGLFDIQDQFATTKRFFGLHSFQHEGLHLGESVTGAGDPLNIDKDREIFVLKRILVEKGTAIYLSGMREKYFGELFLNATISSQERLAGTQFGEQNIGTCGGEPLDHIARFVEFIKTYSQEHFWLVFRNEGQSLSTLLYTAQGTSTPNEDSKVGQVHALEPSLWWKWLKTTEAGQAEMRSLLYQLLLALKACHERNITHRDIKPENMVVRAKDSCIYIRDDGHIQTDMPCNLTMRIIDFGSAIDSYTLEHLYGWNGPSRAEQTAEYTPPEAFLQGHWLKNRGSYGTMYDMWSVGVVMLELILGTPHVFQISARTQALLDQFLAGWDKTPLDTAYILRALWEMCILHPGHTAHQFYSRGSKRWDNIKMVSWICTEESLMQQIKQHDPLGLGVRNIWALRLIRRLLQWYPEDRIAAAEALEHPYFYQG